MTYLRRQGANVLYRHQSITSGGLHRECSRGNILTVRAVWRFHIMSTPTFCSKIENRFFRLIGSLIVAHQYRLARHEPSRGHKYIDDQNWIFWSTTLWSFESSNRPETSALQAQYGSWKVLRRRRNTLRCESNDDNNNSVWDIVRYFHTTFFTSSHATGGTFILQFSNLF